MKTMCRCCLLEAFRDALREEEEEED